jgi:hypothetical protein
MTLHTGGAGVIGQQMLVAVSGSATEELVKPSFGQAATSNIPYDQIKIPGLGKNLGTDGNAYGEANNGASVDVTPTVTGVPMYSFTVGGGAYLLSITANDVTLDPDTVVSSAEFCVGQLVTFGVSGLPGDVDSSQYWSLPGNYVNEAYAYSASCTSYRVFGDLLTNLTTSCWYVDKLQAGTASIGMILHFENGQEVSIAEQGKFNVTKPQVSWVGTQPGSVAVDDDTYENAGMWLHFGYYSGYGHNPGMKYTLDTGAFSGTLFNPLQLITSTSLEFCGTDGHTIHESGNGLDGIGTLAWSTTDSYYYDNPGVPLDSGNNHQSFSGSYQTFLMFDPQISGSIAVPLKLITWDWSGTADASGGWHLTSSSKHVTASDQDTTTFPVWTNIISTPDTYNNVTNTSCD